MNATPSMYLVVGLLLAVAGSRAQAQEATDALASIESKHAAVFEVGRAHGKAGDTISVPVRVSAGARRLSKSGDIEAMDAVAFRIRILPADAVAEARIRRGIEREGSEPRFEAAPAAPDGVSYLAVFEPASDGSELAARFHKRAIVFLDLTLAAGLHVGTRIELRLDPAATVISNAAGTAFLSAADGSLRLRDGWVAVAQ